ncbi:MAG TPA: hypothetical protein VE842_16215 [Pyrinomonadaceae bacterium]|jgi:hypothetical protein|nr:hypothetical protein [Pyrinomonadaceae bacterium]
MLETFKLETFAQHLNSKFLIKPEQADAAAVEVELIEAQAARSIPGQEQFSITFRGPLDAPLRQAMHRFEHAELGAFDLFIVPIKREQDGMYYEAVFARMV